MKSRQLITADTVKLLISTLDQWAAGGKKLVVGIEGYSGSGKTAVLEWVTEHDTRVQPVYIDDFIFDPMYRYELMSQAEDKSTVIELHWADFKAIRKLVDTYKQSRTDIYTIRLPDGDLKSYDLSKPILILEGVFLFNPLLLDKHLDKRVYINIGLQTANKQRVKREKARWGDQYAPESRPDSFYRQFEIAYKRYQQKYKPSDIADLVLSLP